MPNLTAPKFESNAIFLIAPIAIVLVAENLGHVKAVAAMTGRNLDPYLGRAFLGDGLATMIAGAGGGTGVTTYAENIGVMAVTRIYSSLVFVIAGVVAVVMGFSPKFGALIGTIPTPVIGGLAIVLFGLIAVTGGRIWVQNKVDFSESRNLVTAGVALTLGAGDLTLNAGDFSLGGIGTATFAAIIVYQLLRIRTPKPGGADRRRLSHPLSDHGLPAEVDRPDQATLQRRRRRAGGRRPKRGHWAAGRGETATMSAAVLDRLPRCDRPDSAASSSWPRASSRPHSGKTAYGVIRYGRDDVVAVLDSTTCRPERGRRTCPAATSRSSPTLDDALALPNRPDALLIGIAPTGGRLPEAWRSTILAAIGAGLDVLSGLHMFLGDDPEFAAAAAARGTHHRRLPPPPERMETAVGSPPRARQAGDPDGRHRLRHRQDVGRARAAPSRRWPPAIGRRSCRPARPG